MKLSLRKNLLAFALVIISQFLLFSNAEAKCVLKATVKYQQQYGWSKKYTVNVTFMSGMELNQATTSYDYSTYSIYAIIFWGEGQATVIKLKSYLMCGYEVTCNCVQNSIYDLQGHDQDGDKWNICLSGYCY